jgi:ligand-binding SRPBCC domain-containing protein
MLLPFKAGLGGPIGSGKQYVPWIHLEDLVEMFIEAIQNPKWQGIFNATAPTPAPTPVTFHTFAKTLASQLGRLAIVPVPSFALRMLFGEAAQVLLEGQNAVPEKAESMGFPFQYRFLSEAIQNIVKCPDVSISTVTGKLPDSEYLSERPPTYMLQTRTEIPTPTGKVFPFFSQAENLGLLTPPDMELNIVDQSGNMEAGAEIEYKIKLGAIPMSWRTRIDVFDEGIRFVDSQLKGPYASWWHEHRFEETEDGTLMTDTVYYSPPLGVLGKVANAIYISNQLKTVFAYRSTILRLRFDARPAT